MKTIDLGVHELVFFDGEQTMLARIVVKYDEILDEVAIVAYDLEGNTIDAGEITLQDFGYATFREVAQDYAA